MSNPKADGRHLCCTKHKVKRRLWSPEEDEKLIRCLTTHGHGSWSSVPKLAGLHRCGRSCRSRWLNYLRPDLKRGSFTSEEEQIIIDVHRIVGNKWAQIAKHLRPGRTDNEVKNFWNSYIKKRFISQGLDPNTHNIIFSDHQKASRKVACNISHTHQQPISVLSLNSQITDASMEMIKTSSVKVPNFHFPFPQTLDITTTEDQAPNVFWTVKGQSSSDFTSFFSHGSSVGSTANIISSSSSSSSLNQDGFGIINPGGEATLKSFEAPRSEGDQRQYWRYDQKTIWLSKMETDDDQFGEAKVNQNIDASFDAAKFDLGFMESTLLSEASLMDFDLASDMNDLAWS